MTREQNQERFKKFCHDLRNHLTVMKMNTELIAVSPTFSENAELTSFLSTMDQEVNKMIAVIIEAEKERSRDHAS